MKMEVEDERQRLKEDFKNRIFAHSFADPDLFHSMYPEYAQQGGDHPSRVGGEWEVPRSEDELRELMARWDVHRVG